VLPSLTANPIAPGMGFDSPVFVTQAPSMSDTLFVVEQPGRIQVVRDGEIVGTFLDIASRVLHRGERGLLGLAFHPDYTSNGRFFVYYTPLSEHKNVVAEYRVSADPDVADPTEVARLLDVTDPENNHNGGMVVFGPDGLLYVGTGDGGGSFDQHGTFGNALNLDSPFGKLLRLDVDNLAGGYAAAGNPFAGGGGLPQIWAYGLRNPWRFSFDRRTGDLYIGDVGQNTWEEIDVQPADSTGGENYGWRAYEGLSVVSSADVGRVPTHKEPVLVVKHSDDTLLPGSCSITGGYVYRGSAIPELNGVYLFGDYCSPHRVALRYCDGEVMGATRIDDLYEVAHQLVSFGQDNLGELYMVGGGNVFRIEGMSG
jgi:glucose/arabinose dehydrogenase